MTIALRAAGTATAATAAVTAVNPAVPAGAAAGDLSVLTVEVKPYTATITTPTGWTKIGEHAEGTLANGVDTGSTKVALYYKIGAAVGAIGNIGQTSANSMGAVIHTYSTTLGGWVAPTFTTGGDVAAGANYSATGAGGLTVTSGDWVLAATGVGGDIGTVSAQAIGGMSGATLGTVANRTNAAVTTGNDTRLLVSDVPVSSGSSSAAPTFTYTNASTTTGTTMWARLRDTAGALMETVTEDFSAALDSAKWNSFGSPTSVGGRLEMYANSGVYSGIDMNGKTAYLMRGSSLRAKFAGEPAFGASNELFLEAVADANNKFQAFKSGSSTTLYLRSKVGGVNTDQTVTNTDDWWRLREASGVIYLDTSTDGTTWVQRLNITHGMGDTLTSGMYPTISAGDYGSLGPKTFYVDSINITESTVKSGSGSGAWNVAGSATGSKVQAGAATGTWSVAGSSTGTATRSGSGSGAWAVAGSGAGSKAPAGSGEGSWGVSGSATGVSSPAGTGAGGWEVSGTATGQAPSVGTTSGSATGSWSVTGSATGEAPALGTSSGSAAFGWAVVGQAAGSADPKGSALGGWEIEGQAQGAAARGGTASGAWSVGGSAAGFLLVRDLELVAELLRDRLYSRLTPERAEASLVGTPIRASLTEHPVTARMEVESWHGQIA